MKKFNVGLLGCGDVSDIYFETCQTFEILQITACASLHIEKARKKALQHGIPRACSIEELIGVSENAKREFRQGIFVFKSETPEYLIRRYMMKAFNLIF